MIDRHDLSRRADRRTDQSGSGVPAAQPPGTDEHRRDLSAQVLRCQRGLLALLGALVAVLAVSCGTDPGSGDTGGSGSNATVLRVVDGDTIVVDIRGAKERVRLIGIDTPESVKPNSPVECYGKEASAHTKELLPEGTRVRLVLDVEERDRYRRLLAYVYRSSDGVFVNLALAADGYAGLLTYPPNVAHVDEFREAVASARSHGRGLWSACSADLPVGR